MIFRIHGDNIVECERIANIIIQTLNPFSIHTFLVSPSTISVNLEACFLGQNINWTLELLPGFNKNTKRRWKGDIFNPLRKAGSYFDETPDAVISVVEGNNELILLAIEFCSALQAGNQAWQRSARAYSVGRTGCPYIYIVDFVKYELNNLTRRRKNLRFPNASVPYSYINYSELTNSFIAQVYTKSEEFDKSKDSVLDGFDESNFGEIELGNYMVKRMLGMNTVSEESVLLDKNMNVVQFLADKSNPSTNFSAFEWEELYNHPEIDIVDYSVEHNRFGFHKSIATKSIHGQVEDFIALTDWLGVGMASRDLPFGIIPAEDRPAFAARLKRIYPSFDQLIYNEIANTNKHLIVAIYKGFKPRGDDNRPDRGLLPLASMLSSSDVDVLSFIYGPLHEINLKLLLNDPYTLANRNGFWRSTLALSNFVLLDVPVLGPVEYDTVELINTSNIKRYYSELGAGTRLESATVFSPFPIRYGEDDVDTAIHYLFAHVLNKYCFEGMCNPPGGDWSGFSIIQGDYENRWVSLPRVSDVVDGKRPDHILEIFELFDKPVLLSIESKEKSSDLEHNVGSKLVAYIENLMGFKPSATRKCYPMLEDWTWGDEIVDFDDFITIPAAAYLGRYAEAPDVVFRKNCEILFVMNPIASENNIGWEIEIFTTSPRSESLKQFIIEKYNESEDNQFTII